MKKIAGICQLLVLQALLLGCDDDMGKLPVADFSGTWLSHVMNPDHLCLTGEAPPQEGSDRILIIDQSDEHVSLSWYDVCGRLQRRHDGEVTGSVLMSTIESSNPSTYLFCYENFHLQLAGTLEVQTVRASIVVTQSRSGALCPSDLIYSCTDQYALEWQRCPPADCAFQNCATSGF